MKKKKKQAKYVKPTFCLYNLENFRKIFHFVDGNEKKFEAFRKNIISRFFYRVIN